MPPGKKPGVFAVKKVLMKEKSIEAKRKRDMESYREQPEDVFTKTTDEVARQFQEQQVTVTAPIHSSMFLSYNKALGPPFHIWLDTNFINFSMQNKIEIVEGLMDCMLAKVIPCVCNCVMAELEKLGKKFRIALKIARDKRFKRLHCDGKYADDCVVSTVAKHPIYIVATCDQDLKRRLRKIPGVPIMYISKHRYTIERLPEVFGASTAKFYLNLDDPAETERHVLEDLDRLQDEHKRDTTEYLHALLNLSLSYFQQKNYLLARDYAVYAHNKTHELKGSNATFLYFTAKTAAATSIALAERAEEEIRQKEAGESYFSCATPGGSPHRSPFSSEGPPVERRATFDSLAPNPSKLFSLKRVVEKLRSDAKRYDGIAQRLYDRPDKAFMRGTGQSMRGATSWNEDSFHADECYREQYDQAWQVRRKRPEHSEQRRSMQKRTNLNVAK